MILFAVLATWAYCMAAFSNPGHASTKKLLEYRAKKINEIHVKMFLTGHGQKKDPFGIAETEAESATSVVSLMKTLGSGLVSLVDRVEGAE